MAGRPLRVLYLSNAFPPGVSVRFPSLAAAAHATETRMTQALAKQTELSTVGLMPDKIWRKLEPGDNSLGVEHRLLLWERKPKVWHRWRSWRQLRRFYLEEVQRDGPPNVLLVRNLQPVFNYFVRWLRTQQPRPIIVLVLADSGLGQPVPISRRLRYYLKPMQFLEEQTALWYDACLGFGLESRRHFEPRGVPWLWMPSAFNFFYEPPSAAPANGPIRFGYFGGLSKEIGVHSMVKAFFKSGVPGPLRVCGFGGLANTLKELAVQHRNFYFDGLLPRQSECLPWAQQVDVLVNPRLPLRGWDNSFPSKIFEFAMAGKAILSTSAGGVDLILREAGIYVDPDNLEQSLCEKFREVSVMNRQDLQRRGTIIRQRIVHEYHWAGQARRMVQFFDGLLKSPEYRGRAANGQFP